MTNTKKTVQRKDAMKNKEINRTRQEQQDYWKLIKEAFGIKPTEVNAQFVLATQFYKEYLINIVKGRFEVRCPEDWSVDYILDMLISKGRFFITNTWAGILPVDGSAHGVNAFLRPSYLTVTNPILGTFDRKIAGSNANAVVVYLYDDLYYRSMELLLNKYSEKLANVDGSMDINLMNTRTPYIFNAEDNKQAAEAKLIYDKISRGEPAVFTKTKDPLNPDSRGLEVQRIPASENYIFDKLTEARRAIVNEFLTEVGVNSTPYEKRERLVSDEVNSNNEEIEACVSYPKYNLAKCSKKVNAMFPNLNFNIRIKEVNVNVKNDEAEEGKDIHKESNT